MAKKRKRKKNMSTGAWVAIALGIGIGVPTVIAGVVSIYAIKKGKELAEDFGEFPADEWSAGIPRPTPDPPTPTPPFS